MADYYPLIAKAVGGLDKNTGEIRRQLYDRARAALVGQLRGVEPPLNESDITRERLALEEAIRKVESEVSKRKPEPAEEPARPSLSDEGLRGFRAVVADAENLGSAAAAAKRGAHEFAEAVPAEEQPAPPQPTDAAAEPAPELAPPEMEQIESPPEPAAPVELPHLLEPEIAEEPQGAWREQPPFAAAPTSIEEPDYPPPVRSYGRLIKIVVVLILIAGAAGAAYWQRDALGAMIARLRGPAATQQQAAQPLAKPKITDRVGGGQAAAPANAPAAAVAQKVVLYDEDPSNPQGKRYVGSALWRTETVSPGPGLAPEIAVRADVEIPERHIRMTWSLRRNTDKALPASHTIEVVFTLPPDFPEGGIGNVPGVLMKQDEQARGVPLAGLAVKVTNGYFLIGLSAVDVDQRRNIELLKTQDWFDIPIVYTDGKRAILAMEKGVAGKRAFDEAFRAWGE